MSEDSLEMPGGEGRRRPAHLNNHGGSYHETSVAIRTVAGAMGGNDRGETQLNMPGRTVLIENMVGDPANSLEYSEEGRVAVENITQTRGTSLLGVLYATPNPIPSKAPGESPEPDGLGMNIDVWL